ncbi:GntR family transcriptional regulator [Ensifer sp. IC4062]|nr:GntR family transcriptional regulator [Ensifer sp. IC4062]MCA1441910.1 GntR family transcriptional regulator [Ensifer sp. IC4062]
MAESDSGTERVSSSLHVLRNVSISELVYQQVHQKILSGDLQPGEHMNENRLAASLEVSRASVREALRQLEKDGLIEITKNKGPFVRDMPSEEAWELYDIRASLEGLAAELAAKNRTEYDLGRLTQCLENMDRAIARGDEAGIFDYAVDFHRIVAAMSGSQNLVNMLTGVWGRLVLFRSKFSRLHLGEPGNSEEKRILAAIRDRDGEAASALMKAHITGGKEGLMKHAQEHEATAGSRAAVSGRKKP